MDAVRVSGAVATDGQINIEPGVTSETIRIVKAVLLTAPSGPARIGVLGAGKKLLDAERPTTRNMAGVEIRHLRHKLQAKA